MGDFYLVRKNLFRKKTRAVLMLVSIFVAFLLFGVLANFQRAFDVGEDLAKANRLVTVNRINFTQPLPYSYFNKVKLVEGVSLVSHANWFGGYFRENRNQIVTFAVDPESYLDISLDVFMLPPDQRAAFLADKGSMVITKPVADQYGWKIGDRIPLSSNIFTNTRTGTNTWEFTIAGILEMVDKRAESPFALFHYQYFNETQSFEKDYVGWLILLTTDAAANDRVIETIDAMFANSPFETETTTEGAFNKAFLAQLGNIALIVTLVVGSAFATILLIVGNTMVMAVRERTREIAVLKTLGFRAPRIFRMVLGESLLLALLGGMLGMAAAVGLISLLRDSLVNFVPGMTATPEVWALGVGFMLLLGLITGIVPAMNAMRLDIISALGRD